MKYKTNKLSSFLAVVILLLGMVVLPSLWLTGGNIKIATELIGIGLALLLGIGGLLQEQIRRWFFPPSVEVHKPESFDVPAHNGHIHTYYKLPIKNVGFTAAKNIRIKIRDNKKKTWVFLTRPHTWARSKKTVLKNLSSRESDYFNIAGRFKRGPHPFRLQTNIEPNNQKTRIGIGEECTYFLSVVADNAKPKYYRLRLRYDKESEELRVRLEYDAPV